MARTSRTRVCWSLIGVLMWCVAASPSPRVRTTDAAIASLLSEATSRSAVFRNLVRAIESTDGIVYVERGRCGHGVHACLSLSMVAGEGYRLLRILVESVDDPVLAMATIGHELQHVIELLTEPGVRSSTAAYLYYMREAPTARDSFSAFETPAAVRTGLAVERELKDSGGGYQQLQ